MASSKQVFSGTDVSCVRGGRILFEKLSFGINPGDVIHLSGANGAGKSSLLRIMCGALPAAEGKILWEGKDFLENGAAVHNQRYAFLPADDRSLKSLETVHESIRFWADIWHVTDEACDAALDKMQLLDLKDVPVRRLSTGQKRRLSLARTFIKSAPLWLLDEPFSGLDHGSHKLLMKVLDEHCANGGMIVVASHNEVDPPKHGHLHRVRVGAK